MAASRLAGCHQTLSTQLAHVGIGPNRYSDVALKAMYPPDALRIIDTEFISLIPLHYTRHRQERLEFLRYTDRS